MNIESYVKFVKAHEQLVLIVGSLFVIFFLGNHLLGYLANRASVKAELAQQVAQAASQKSEQIEKEVLAQENKYQQLIAILAQQNQSLVGSITARDQKTAAAQEQVGVEPLPLVISTWQSLVPGTQLDDFKSSADGIDVNSKAARATVQQLQLVPTLKADLKDTQEMAANKDKEIASANQLIGGLRQQVSALNIEITDNKKACSTQISAIKAKARHSKLSWFARGLATGAGIVAFLLH